MSNLLSVRYSRSLYTLIVAFITALLVVATSSQTWAAHEPENAVVEPLSDTGEISTELPEPTSIEEESLSSSEEDDDEILTNVDVKSLLEETVPEKIVKAKPLPSVDDVPNEVYDDLDAESADASELLLGQRTIEVSEGEDDLTGIRDGYPVVAAREISVGELAAALYPRQSESWDIGHGRPDLLLSQHRLAEEGSVLSVESLEVPGAAREAGVALLNRVNLLSQENNTWAGISIDLSSLEGAYGADYVGRIKFLALPNCVLTRPDDINCLTGTSLKVTQREDGLVEVIAPVDALALQAAQGTYSALKSTGELGVVIAAVSGPSSDMGDFTATNLAPRGTWGVISPTGAFTYTYPIELPPVASGYVPTLSLNYSSQAVDGRTASSNGQNSMIGEGWNLSSSYIERLFKACEFDGGSGPQPCWDSPYANHAGEAAYVLSLNGSTHELVWLYQLDGASYYTAATDPSIQVKRFWGAKGRAGNGDNDGDYFEVRTSDGATHYFGFNPGGPSSPSQSVAVQPVLSNHAGEPHRGTASQVLVNDQGYRFMLDLSVDVNGNAATYFYEKEENRYNNGGTKIYTRDIYIRSIEYGQRFDSVSKTVSEAEAKVDFEKIVRCVEAGQFIDTSTAGTITCDTLSKQNAKSFPDVPVDLVCTSSCTSAQNAPVYFSTHRIGSITTSVLSDVSAGWVPVQTTQLITAFPNTGDVSARALWLDSIYTKYWGDPDTVDDLRSYLTKFAGVRLNNRVGWKPGNSSGQSPYRAFDKMRISSVWTEMGGRVDVTYAKATASSLTSDHFDGDVLCPQESTTSSQYTSWLAANPISKINSVNNTSLCFAAKVGSEVQLYHQYVVEKLSLVDVVGGTPEQIQGFHYVGNPAYERSESLLFAPGASGDSSSFDSYRGFKAVKSYQGDESNGVATYSQYFRGLPGTRGNIASLHDGAVRTDDPRLQGRLESSKTVEVVDGVETVVSSQKSSLNAWPVGTAPNWDRTGVTNNRIPHHVREVANRTAEYDGTWERHSLVNTTYETTNYLPIQARTSVGETSAVGDFTSCVQNEYVSSSAPYLVLPSRVTTYEGECGTGIMTSKFEVGYDGQEPGSAVLSRGLVTLEREYDTATTSITTTASYDELGRVAAAWLPEDVGNAQPSVSWVYGVDGDLRTTQVNRPLGETQKTWTNRAYGNVVKAKGSTTKAWTHYQYDSAGLLTAAWSPTLWGLPETPDLATDTPDVLHVYDVYAQGPALRTTPVAVAQSPYTRDDGTTYIGHPLTGTTQRTYTFMDGWGRTLESHAVARDGSGNRIVTAQGYDGLGQLSWSSQPFVASGSARFKNADGSPALVNPEPEDLLSYTSYEYDLLGRVSSEKIMSLGSVHQVDGTALRTAYEYGDGSSTVVRADGSTQISSVDLLGRLTASTETPSLAFLAEAPIVTMYSYETLSSGEQRGFTRTVVEDPDGNLMATTADLAGRRTHLDDPNSGESSYSYDLNGRLTAVLSEVSLTEYEYDEIGRRVQTIIDGQIATESEYIRPTDPEAADKLGLLIREDAYNRSDFGVLKVGSEYDYDNLGRVTKLRTVLPESPIGTSLLGEYSGMQWELSKSYDELGRPAATIYPQFKDLPNEQVSVEYAMGGTVVAVAASGIDSKTSLLIDTNLDPYGNVKSKTLGNQVERRYLLDPVTREIVGLEAAAVLADDPTGAERVIQSLSIKRDALGRIAERAETVVGNGNFTECFAYDGFNRLKSSLLFQSTEQSPCAGDAHPYMGENGSPSLARMEEWGYSPAGRISRRIHPDGTLAIYQYDDPEHPSAATTLTAESDVIGDFDYDQAGRMISRVAGSSSQELSWDGSSRLGSVRSGDRNTVYLYASSGLRVASSVVDNGVVDTVAVWVGDDVYEDKQPLVAGGAESVRYYGDSGVTLAIRSPGGMLFALGNEQGSAVIQIPSEVSTAGTSSISSVDLDHVATTMYSPYGSVLLQSGEWRGGRKWLGQTFDANTDLTYLNARYYDQSIGRFVSVDPFLDPGDYRTLDPYRYADNNPISYSDPSGLFPFCYGVMESLCERGKAAAYLIHKNGSLNNVTGLYDITLLNIVKGKKKRSIGEGLGDFVDHLESFARGIIDTPAHLTAYNKLSVEVDESGQFSITKTPKTWIPTLGPVGSNSSSQSMYVLGGLASPGVGVSVLKLLSAPKKANTAVQVPHSPNNPPASVTFDNQKIPVVAPGTQPLRAADNGRGIIYPVPQGTVLAEQVTMVRVMEAKQAWEKGYVEGAEGYLVFMNRHFQTTHPIDGTGGIPRSDPASHIPFF